jgi:hypothetical protein
MQRVRGVARRGTRAAKRNIMRLSFRPAALLLAAVSIFGSACDRTDEGHLPVGEAQVSVLEEDRFLKRLSMDLVGARPDEVELADLRAELDDGGNTPEVRAAIAQRFIARPEFAESYVAEVQSAAFAGERIEVVYDLVCLNFLAFDSACFSCVPAEDDLCSCACPSIAALAAEREMLLSSADDLMAGTSTAQIDRRHVASDVFQLNAGPSDVIADLLFQGFLGRPPEAEELRNVRAFSLGSTIAGMKAILFLELGENYADMVSIVFGSEVYREAAVDAVFSRYLGRHASPVELVHFVGTLDKNNVDVRNVISVVVSSEEYFSQ